MEELAHRLLSISNSRYVESLNKPGVTGWYQCPGGKTCAAMERLVRVILLRSNELLWRGVRSTLLEQTDIRVVEDTNEVKRVLRTARSIQPDVIVASIEVEGTEKVALATQIRESALTSKLVFVGDVIDKQTQLMLWRVPIDGYLSSNQLTIEVLRQAVISASVGLRVATPAVYDKFLIDERELRAHLPGLMSLNDKEKAVLEGLTHGLTEGEIAEMERVSLRTIQRVVARLKARWKTPTLASLALQAHGLGFG